MIKIKPLIAIAFVVGFFAVLIAVTVTEFIIPDLLLGALIVQLTLVMQYYFRKKAPKQ